MYKEEVTRQLHEILEEMTGEEVKLLLEIAKGIK